MLNSYHTKDLLNAMVLHLTNQIKQHKNSEEGEENNRREEELIEGNTQDRTLFKRIKQSLISTSELRAGSLTQPKKAQ